jgi:hypothetical protein
LRLFRTRAYAYAAALGLVAYQHAGELFDDRHGIVKPARNCPSWVGLWLRCPFSDGKWFISVPVESYFLAPTGAGRQLSRGVDPGSRTLAAVAASVPAYTIDPERSGASVLAPK